MVHDGVLYTPDLAAGVLPGITRQQILECAHRLKIPVVEGPISRALLDQAAELMISSSLRELVAVVMLDDEPIGEGSPGPICRQLHAAYREQCVDRR
jgi:D-alanine transaminase